jgi:C4-dicarboxylate-specific signal transduction histidine kinase
VKLIRLTENHTETPAVPRREVESTGPRLSIDAGVLIDSLSTQMAVLDRSGMVTRVNDAWRAIVSDGIGGEHRTPAGRSYLDECRRAEMRGCDGAREVRQGIEAVLARRMTRFHTEFGCHPEDRRYEIIVDALNHTDGGAVLSLVDVTDRRRVEAAAELARRHAAHEGRMTMMSEIASALALEIKQPVTAIRLNALAGATLLGSPRTAFESVWSDSREAWQMFKDIYDDASRASTVIEHVHQHVRRQGVHGGIVDLGDTCRTTAKLLEHEAARRDARIDLDLEPEVPAIVGDAIEIQQIVMSLAQNALDAVASSSERVVTLGTTARQGGAEVELYVRDTGPGLTAAVRQHLFESFFTTKERGLGMGLIIVRSIAERHRGRVSAEVASDGDGGGAIFRVHLPVS